jgi:hypothetical protein
MRVIAWVEWIFVVTGDLQFALHVEMDFLKIELSNYHTEMIEMALCQQTREACFIQAPSVWWKET